MKKLYIAESKLDGHGVFAQEPIKAGEFVSYIKGSIVKMVNVTEADSVAFPNWVGFKKDAWIDPTPPLKYLNHSCEPNCGIRGTKTVMALKNIKKNEELTIDYAITEMDMDWYIMCTCGNKICRKKITSIQTLTNSRFLKYAPNIPTYFMNYYKKYYLK